MGKGVSIQHQVEYNDREQQIENELRYRIEQHKAIADISLLALKTNNPHELMDKVVVTITRLLEVEYCKILELLPGGKELLLAAGTGWKSWARGARFKASKKSPAGVTLSTGKPVVVDNLIRETRFSDSQLLREHNVISGMSTIIPGKEGPYGVLGVYSTQKRSFSSDDTYFLNAVANALASTIERIRTENELRLSHDELGVTLSTIADGITAQDLNGNLVYANTSAAQVIGFNTVEDLLKAPIETLMERFEVFDEDGNLLGPSDLPGRVVMQGAAEAHKIVRFRYKDSGKERWSQIKSKPVRDASGKVVKIVNIFQDITDLKRSEMSQRLLAEAGKIFSASLDYTKTLQSVADLVVTILADWCSISLVEDDDDTVNLVAVAHKDPEKVKLAEALYERYPFDIDNGEGVARVLKSGKPEFIASITDEMIDQAAISEDQANILKKLGLQSAIIMPLIARGRTVGVLSLIWAESGRQYNQYDVYMAEELARQAAIAIDNALLYHEAQNANALLEQRVHQRTSQLQALISKLSSEIAERKKMEDALLKNEAMLQSLFEAAPDATVLVDDSSRIVRINAQMEHMFGYSREELIGKEMDMLLPERFREIHKKYSNHFYNERIIRPMGTGFELYGLRKDGTEFPVDIMLSPVETLEGIRVLSAIRDITQRKQIESELAEVQRRLIDSLESERLFLAQELHDGVIQDLYGVVFSLKSIEDVMKEGKIAPFPGSDSLQLSKESVQHAIDSLRTICGELRPPALAPFGLEKAIRAHVDTTRDANPGLNFHLNLASDGQVLPEHMRLALYRIYQHAVSNVIRHAAAKNLHITFDFDSTQVMLEIRDDGCGFSLPSRWIDLAREGHLGLIGTVERAEAIGGRLNITSIPGKGTTILVTVPLGKNSVRSESNWLLRSQRR